MEGPGSFRIGEYAYYWDVIRCRFVFSGKNDKLTPDFLQVRELGLAVTKTVEAAEGDDVD